MHLLSVDQAQRSIRAMLGGMERRYVTLYMGPGTDAPTLDLMKGSGQRVVVFAERADPQPPGLPEGMVAIVLPPNCYIDTNESGM